MSQKFNPLREIVKGSAFATLAAVLVPLQTWIYHRSDFDAKLTIMWVIGAIQAITLVISLVILSRASRMLRKRD